MFLKNKQKQLKIREIAKNHFNTDRSGVSLDKQEEIFNELLRERALEFYDIKDKIDPNNLVYVQSTAKNNPKDFGKYQMPMKLFEDLRDGQIDKKDEFKNHARLKSDLSGIKRSGKKSADQKIQ